jgi:hypothetical protein
MLNLVEVSFKVSLWQTIKYLWETKLEFSNFWGFYGGDVSSQGVLGGDTA